MSLAAWCDEYLAQIHVGGPYVLQETYLFSTQRGSEGCRWGQRGKGKVWAPIGLCVCGLPQKGTERTFTTSSIWASAAHSFVFSWNSDGESSVGAP